MRRKDREVTDINEILRFIDTAQFLHLGLFDDPYPYVVPLHYGYTYENGFLTFYMHGAREGHKLDLIRNNSHVFIELECDVEDISGGEVPCSYGSAFASVMARGQAEFIEDPAAKMTALNILMEHQTGRQFPFTEQMTAGVSVIKVTVDSFTAKCRPKPAK